MEARASGIILRTRPLTETSLIVQWITPDLGRIATVAKGARRPKSPFRGKLDLFYEADFSFARSRRGELHTLREVSLRNSHAPLRSDLAWLHQASYFALLIEKSTESETPLAEIHALMQSALEALPRQNASANTIFAFELKLLSLLGYRADLSPLPPAARNAGERMLHGSFEDSFALQKVPAELNRLLRMSLGTTLERLPPQRERALANTP